MPDGNPRTNGDRCAQVEHTADVDPADVADREIAVEILLADQPPHSHADTPLLSAATTGKEAGEDTSLINSVLSHCPCGAAEKGSGAITGERVQHAGQLFGVLLLVGEDAFQHPPRGLSALPR